MSLGYSSFAKSLSVPFYIPSLLIKVRKSLISFPKILSPYYPSPYYRHQVLILANVQAWGPLHICLYPEYASRRAEFNSYPKLAQIWLDHLPV